MTDASNPIWTVSAKGNLWTEYKSTHLVVGGSQTTRYWVRVKDKFLKIRFDTLEEAKAAAVEATNEN